VRCLCRIRQVNRSLGYAGRRIENLHLLRRGNLIDLIAAWICPWSETATRQDDVIYPFVKAEITVRMRSGKRRMLHAFVSSCARAVRMFKSVSSTVWPISCQSSGILRWKVGLLAAPHSHSGTSPARRFRSSPTHHFIHGPDAGKHLPTSSRSHAAAPKDPPARPLKHDAAARLLHRFHGTVGGTCPYSRNLP